MPRRLGKLQRVPLEEGVDQVGACAVRKEQRDDFDMVDSYSQNMSSQAPLIPLIDCRNSGTLRSGRS
jgi:hypothetical protein